MFALLAQIAAALQPGLIKITVDSVLGNEPLTHTALERLVALFGAAAYYGRSHSCICDMPQYIYVFADEYGKCSNRAGYSKCTEPVV